MSLSCEGSYGSTKKLVTLIFLHILICITHCLYLKSFVEAGVYLRIQGHNVEYTWASHQSITGPTTIHSYRQLRIDNQLNLHIFGLLEENRGKNPHNTGKTGNLHILLNLGIKSWTLLLQCYTANHCATPNKRQVLEKCKVCVCHNTSTVSDTNTNSITGKVQQELKVKG